MTVRENLEFPLRRHWIQVSQDEVKAMVMEALEDVGLAHTIDMMPERIIRWNAEKDCTCPYINFKTGDYFIR